MNKREIMTICKEWYQKEYLPSQLHLTADEKAHAKNLFLKLQGLKAETSNVVLLHPLVLNGDEYLDSITFLFLKTKASTTVKGNLREALLNAGKFSISIKSLAEFKIFMGQVVLMRSEDKM
jgi:hypothetical protein